MYVVCISDHVLKLFRLGVIARMWEELCSEEQRLCSVVACEESFGENSAGTTTGFLSVGNDNGLGAHYT